MKVVGILVALVSRLIYWRNVQWDSKREDASERLEKVKIMLSQGGQSHLDERVDV